MNELDRLATWRGAAMAWFVAALIWSTSAMARDVGRREAKQLSRPAALSDTKADRMARTWLGLMQYHAQRMENQ